MKRKSPRGIPDFSHHQPAAHGVPATDANGRVVKKVQRQPQPVQQVKPHSTSMKSGRRGS